MNAFLYSWFPFFYPNYSQRVCPFSSCWSFQEPGLVLPILGQTRAPGSGATVKTNVTRKESQFEERCARQRPEHQEWKIRATKYAGWIVGWCLVLRIASRHALAGRASHTKGKRGGDCRRLAFISFVLKWPFRATPSLSSIERHSASPNSVQY